MFKVGDRFARLVVIGPSYCARRQTHQWLCRCDCGREKAVDPKNLISGTTKSCGCFRRERIAQMNREHPPWLGKGTGITPKNPTREYNSWTSMRGRCLNPRNPKFRHYGGRGITICEAWTSYDTFLRDMGPRPEGTTLDRINNDGNYEPGNCRWATSAQQHASQRRGRRGGSHRKYALLPL